jgi:hypothetical protein
MWQVPDAFPPERKMEKSERGNLPGNYRIGAPLEYITSYSTFFHAPIYAY